MNKEIIFINNQDVLFKEVKRIRNKVFVKEQNIPLEEEYDKFDEYISTSYVLICYQEHIVGTLRIIIKEDGYKLGRIAIDRNYRSLGIGKIMITKTLNALFDLNKKANIYIDSQIHALGFYKKFGFEVIGEEFLERSKMHIPLKLTINNYLPGDFNE